MAKYVSNRGIPAPRLAKTRVGARQPVITIPGNAGTTAQHGLDSTRSAAQYAETMPCSRPAAETSLYRNAGYRLDGARKPTRAR
jgi:hypothetical protein